MKKSKQQQRLFEMLSDMYDKHQSKPIHYSEHHKFIDLHKLSYSISTSLIRTGFAIKISRGWIALKNKPTLEQCEIILKHHDEMRLIAKNKREQKIQPSLNLNVDLEKDPIDIDEDYCISFLKNRGYKIMKPITEYKEL